ncbi:MAG: hypothetical protein JSW25_07105, partial [Thermoplasmata archaeon]
MATLIITISMVVTAVPMAGGFPYDVHQHSELVVLDTWQDPGGGGQDLSFRVNDGGTRLLTLGYGAPGEVRLADMDMGNPLVIYPSVPSMTVTGCDWNTAEDQVVIWGEAGGTPVISIHDLPSGEVDTTVRWTDLVDLMSVSEISFLAFDEIVSVAGRDGDGTSHLMFIEVASNNVRWDHVWPGNHTVVAVEDEGGQIVVLDTGEDIAVLTGGEWTSFERYMGVLEGGPTAWHVPKGSAWGVADAGGHITGSLFDPLTQEDAIKVVDGPVTGFAWTQDRYLDFVVATDAPGGDSVLAGWELFPEFEHELIPHPLASLEVEGHVTMMSKDPRGWSRVLVAMDDGALISVQLVVRPYPTEMRAGDPDIADGRGMEPFISWYPGGTSIEHRFLFNHRGSLVALMGFGSRNDVRVIDREFETVAKLGLPGLPTLARGLEWSTSDGWLLVWGHEGTEEDPKLRVRAYDTPYFNRSETFDEDALMEVAHDILSLEFLDGDEVLVVSCLDDEGVPVLMTWDVLAGEVLTKVPTEPGLFLGLETDGEHIVGIKETGSIWTMSAPDWVPERLTDDTEDGIWAWDVNTTSGWAMVGYQLNYTVWNGTPREQAVRWEVHPNDPVDLVWSNGMDGDMLLGMRRWAVGSTVQLWRQGTIGTQEWRHLDGFTMMTQLNSSKDLVQLEADPAYEGMFMASFSDGTMVLYHLNMTPYPPPPDDLGDLDTGPIYPPPEPPGDDGSGGDGSLLPWGSSSNWVFPVLLMVAIVGL